MFTFMYQWFSPSHAWHPQLQMYGLVCQFIMPKVGFFVLTYLHRMKIVSIQVVYEYFSRRVGVHHFPRQESLHPELGRAGRGGGGNN